MAESGGEDEGQNLLAVVVDINPNQVTSAMTNGNCFAVCKTLETL